MSKRIFAIKGTDGYIGMELYLFRRYRRGLLKSIVKNGKRTAGLFERMDPKCVLGEGESLGLRRRTRLCEQLRSRIASLRQMLFLDKLLVLRLLDVELVLLELVLLLQVLLL